MNKKEKIIFGICIISGFILWLIITFVGNKSFLKDYYAADDGTKIPVPRFSYYKDDIKSSRPNAHFYTLKSTSKIRKYMDNYLENLQSCYDEGYFYDKDNDITIYYYNIENKFPFNNFYLEYEYGNYCENEFVLEDEWINGFLDKATIIEMKISNLTKEEIEKPLNNDIIQYLTNNFINKDYTRIENKTRISVSDYNYLIKIYYTLDRNMYELSIFDYKTNHIAFVQVDANDHQKNAIYEVSNVFELFEEICKD